MIQSPSRNDFVFCEGNAVSWRIVSAVGDGELFWATTGRRKDFLKKNNKKFG